MASFTTYQSKLRDGLPSRDDAKWVEELLGKFMNRQTALFMRWLDLKLPSKTEERQRLVVITPLRIILIKTKTFGRSVHRKYRIIDITSVRVDDSDDKRTLCEITHCDFPPELSISRSREKLKNNEYSKQSVMVYLPKDIDREFLDIMQWSLFIVTRGLPNKFKPKIDIPKTFQNNISDPVGPGQFVIDRYVAYCDAQSKNSGAGIAASENLIEYTLGSVQSGVYDINLAFNKTSKKIDPLQFVCLSQGLSFTTVYKKLVLNQLAAADDTNIAILMTLLETNFAIKTLEFRRVDVQTKAMRSLSSALSCTNGLSKLQEINMIDISINKNIVLSLSNGLSYIKLKVLRLTNCNLNKTATIQLFSTLQKSEQYKNLTHLNLSKNQCGKQGTKAIAAFLNKCAALQVLVVADAGLDGNEFFAALTTEPGANNLCHLDTLTLLDFSGNAVGERGAAKLSKFVQSSRCLNYLKLARCNLSITQLQKILHAALKNMQGFPENEYNGKRRPTHAEIMLCTNLLCLSLDLSDNNLGSKGAEVVCNVLTERENYTIVSLNLAKNNFNVHDMKNIICGLTSLACLERLCISENVKRGIGKKTDKDGVIGEALLYLFEQVPTLNELAITGSEQSNCYLDMGLHTFLAQIDRISNLEFLDFTGNKIGDKQFVEFLQSLQRNLSIRLIRCNDNKISTEMLVHYMELLASHPSIIDKLPVDDSRDKRASSKMSADKNKQYATLKESAKHNLRANKQQFNLDRQMMTSLSREMRLEKELRRACGTQFGIVVERIRGTVQYPDYASRIPQVLVKLKNLLEARGGFHTVGIFRIQPDAKEFPVVKQALNTNNFEFRINDINCIANAIKVWFRDLPHKVLNSLPKETLTNCTEQEQVADAIKTIAEPYKSLFEWLLDLAVQVVYNVDKNKMDAKNMAVVLCPNLYETEQTNNDALYLQQSLLRFTELAIRHRVQFRKSNPVTKIDDMLAIQAGLTPGIADQNKLAKDRLVGDEDEDDDDDEDNQRMRGLDNDAANEEGDGFAGALYSGSRFRGSSQAHNEAANPLLADRSSKNKSSKNRHDDDEKVFDHKPPPPAYADFGGDEEEAQHFNDIAEDKGVHAKNMSVKIESGKVKNVAAKLAIDPTAMLPGAKGPQRPKIAPPSQAAAAPQMDEHASLAKPVQAKKGKKSKKGKKNKKQMLLESMVDNYDEAAAAGASVPDEEAVAAQSSPRRQSHHVPMESKVLGGFVQPGLAMLAMQSAENERQEAAEEEAARNKKKKRKGSDDSDDEALPALAHLSGEDMNSGGENDGDGAADAAEPDYAYEERVLMFETKPMGFQIEAENGKISVRSVRAMSMAGSYGVKEKWDIVAVNGFRDWSSVLGILESSLGPFKITFAVPVMIASQERSMSKSSQQQHSHPIVPPAAAEEEPEEAAAAAVAAPSAAYAVEIPPPAQEAQPQPHARQQSQTKPVSYSKREEKKSAVAIIPAAGDDDEMKEDEYAANKRNFDMMQRNSSAIAKQVLNEYENDEADNDGNAMKTNASVYDSSSSVQQREFLRLEAEIQRLHTKNAQLLETLQVIRLKGEMERIELHNAKQVQVENNKLKQELNSKIKPLKNQLKNANKQIQTQRQLMYQYANLLRRNKIAIPELQASLQENESSSDSDSD